MRTRFAPSPTGPLHLGHALSALTVRDLAVRAGGTALLRFEDLDRARCRPAWEAAIRDDLLWLGFPLTEPVRRQSDHLAEYEESLATLWARGLLYGCTCNRRDIAEAAGAPQEGAPLLGPDGFVYPGTCRATGPRGPGPLPAGVALRLDMAAAFDALGGREPAFEETGGGEGVRLGLHAVTRAGAVGGIGDVVLRRREAGTPAYHLAVVHDDALQGITDVVRGADLFEATQIHVVLQGLLGLPTPRYNHHRLVRDAAGRRLAKRDDARAIARYRAEGLSPGDLRRMLALPAP